MLIEAEGARLQQLLQLDLRVYLGFVQESAEQLQLLRHFRETGGRTAIQLHHTREQTVIVGERHQAIRHDDLH